MTGRRAAVLFMLLSLALTACSPVGMAEEWAKLAQEQGWRAEYRVVFHQADNDLAFTIIEEHIEDVLTLDITGPGGQLELRFSAGDLSLVLDRGELEWQQSSCGPPHYSLLLIARHVLKSELTVREGWVEAGLYRLKLARGIPEEIQYGEDWTLTVISFQSALGSLSANCSRMMSCPAA